MATGSGVTVTGIDATAKAMGVSPTTISRWRQRGAPCTEDGGRLVFDLGALDAWRKANHLSKRRGRQSASKEALRRANDARRERGEQPRPTGAPTLSTDELAKLSPEDLAAIGAMFDGLDTRTETALEIAQKIPEEMLARVEAAWKAGKTKAEADKRKLDLAQRRGELVDLEEVQRAGVQAVAHAKAVILSLPGKLSARLENRTASEIETELERELRAVLETFAREFPGNEGEGCCE